MPTEERVRCVTPTTQGNRGTNIPKWKYDLLRAAIRKVVPKTKQGVAFGELYGLVAGELSADERKRLGSLSWHTTTVKLHLEVIGELERVPDAQPQRLRRVK